MSENERRSETPRVDIARLPAGVPGLDAVLGGGLPEYAFTVIAGAPGTGKTTLAHQIVFTLASPARRALYFSVMGEPTLKMLRYQQQMDYFDPAKVGASIDYVNLSEMVLTGDLEQVLADIVRRVEEGGPGLVVLDSFHNIVRAATGQEQERAFVGRYEEETTIKCIGQDHVAHRGTVAGAALSR